MARQPIWTHEVRGIAPSALDGSTGVKYATHRILQALKEDKPHYLIRADIKSFYKSIPHHKLIQAIKKHYDDPKVQAMLKNIITSDTS